jgi:zinc D-Ala-D-Ala carboxypeptidase
VTVPTSAMSKGHDFSLTTNFTFLQFIQSPTARRKKIDNWPDSPIIAARLKGLCVNILEPLQAQFGKVNINSGYRCPALNKAVGSTAKHSNHLDGYAADIHINGIDNRKLAMWVRDNMVYRELLLEFHHNDAPESGWVHVAYAIDNSNGKKTGTIRKNKKYAVGIV